MSNPVGGGLAVGKQCRAGRINTRADYRLLLSVSWGHIWPKASLSRIAAQLQPVLEEDGHG